MKERLLGHTPVGVGVSQPNRATQPQRVTPGTPDTPRCDCVGACGRTFLTEDELADRLRLSVKTIQNWRVTGGGIPFVKGRGFVRYRIGDVVAWERANTRVSTTQGGRNV